MRIRHKPYAYPELCSWPHFIKDPPALRGQWHALFGNDAPIVLELGCGKGAFASQYAAAHPDRNLIASISKMKFWCWPSASWRHR